MKMNGYPRLSEIVAGNTVNMTQSTVKSNGNVSQLWSMVDILQAMLGCNVEPISLDGYQNLESKDTNTLYIVTDGAADTFSLYYGDKKLDGGGGGGCEHVLLAMAIGAIIECSAISATTVEE